MKVHDTPGFPLTAYVNGSGSTGLVSYNADTGDFLIVCKSKYMEDAFRSRVKYPDILKEWLKGANCTLIFEYVDMLHDTHIIDYDYSHLFLCDIVKNQPDFEKLSYNVVQEIGHTYGFETN